MIDEVKEFITKNVDLVDSFFKMPLKMDVIELTLMLKAAGFRLESLDFTMPKAQRSASESVKIEIQCQKSGIVSKMVYKPEVCGCPIEEESMNNSFWEIQASAPSTSSNQEFQDASSTLLPNVAPQAMDFTRTLMHIMLAKFDLAKAGKDVPKTKKQPHITVKETSSGPIATAGPTPQLISPVVTNGLASDFRTPLSSINITPVGPNDFLGDTVGMPKIILSEATVASSSGISNDNEMFRSPSSDIFTSSPCVTPSPPMSLSQRNKLISNLREARDKIDFGLTLLNFDLTQDIIDSSLQRYQQRAEVPPGKNDVHLAPIVDSIDRRRHSLAVMSSRALMKPVSNGADAAASTVRRMSINGTNPPTESLNGLPAGPAAAVRTNSMKRTGLTENARLKSKMSIGSKNKFVPKGDTPRPTVPVSSATANGKSSTLMSSVGVGVAGPSRPTVTGLTKKPAASIKTSAVSSVKAAPIRSSTLSTVKSYLTKTTSLSKLPLVEPKK